MDKVTILASLNKALEHVKAAQALLIEVDSNDDDIEIAIEAIEEEIAAVIELDL